MATEEELVVRARLRDELSGPLRAVRGEVEATAKSVAATAGNAAKAAGSAGIGALDKATSNFGGRLRGLRSDLRGVSSDLDAKLLSGLHRAELGVGLLTAAIGGFGLKSVSTFQQTQVALEGFLGSAGAAQSMLGDIKNLSLKAPFTFSTLAGSSRQLLGFGFDPNQVKPLLDSVTNISAGLGGGGQTLDRIILDLGEIQSQGVVTGRQLRNLAMVGFPGYQLLANILGVNIDQVRNMGDGATVSADKFIAAVTQMSGPLQRFTGQAGRQMTTLSGQWTNLVDTVQYALVAAGKPFADQFASQAPKLIAQVGTMVEKVGPPVFDLLGTIARIATALLPALAPVFATIVGGLDKLLRAAEPSLPLFDKMFAALSDSLGDLITSLVPVMPDVVMLLVDLVGLLPDFVRLLTDLVPLVDPILRLVDGLLNFGPTRVIIEGLLVALMGFRALDAAASSVMLLVAALRALAGAQAQVAATSGVGGAAGVAGSGSGILAAGGAARYLGAGGAIIAGGAGAYESYTNAANNGVNVGNVLGGAASGALIGGGIGSLVPGVGTVIGAGIGGVIGGAGSVISGLFGGSKPKPQPAAAPAGARNVDNSLTMQPGAVVIDARGLTPQQIAALLPSTIESYQRDRAERGVGPAVGVG